jgi:hypothetical protein
MLLNNAAQPVVCKYRYLTYATTTLLILLYVGICILLMLQQRWSPCYMYVSVSYSCYNSAAQSVVCKYLYLTYVTITLLILLYVSIGILLMLQQRCSICCV